MRLFILVLFFAASHLSLASGGGGGGGGKIPCYLNLSALMSQQNFHDMMEDMESRNPSAAAAAAAAAAADQSAESFQGEAQGAKIVPKIRKKRIRFHSSAKNYDGLSSVPRIIDELFYAYFESQSIGRDPENIKTLFEEKSLIDLAGFFPEVENRIQNLYEKSMELEDDDEIPLLLKGGGRGLRLQNKHARHVRNLKRVFQAFRASLAEEDTVVPVAAAE